MSISLYCFAVFFVVCAQSGASEFVRSRNPLIQRGAPPSSNVAPAAPAAAAAAASRSAAPIVRQDLDEKRQAFQYDLEQHFNVHAVQAHVAAQQKYYATNRIDAVADDDDYGGGGGGGQFSDNSNGETQGAKNSRWTADALQDDCGSYTSPFVIFFKKKNLKKKKK